MTIKQKGVCQFIGKIIMKYPTINKTFIPLSFSPTRNEVFEDEDNTTIVSRSMTEREKKIYRKFQFWRTWTFIMTVLCLAFSLFLTIVTIVKDGANFLIMFAWAVSLFCETVSVVLNSRIVDRRDEWINERVKYGFRRETRAFESHNRLIEEQARLWRTEHPLEERLRKAMESKNCVDIADIIREVTGANET